ncbi:MAG: hypothetical protein JXR51_10365 [Bacteroidales bacterium]|nr:hypothetical protein [Bacteroidales bacterium]MBN2757569.1 hypothetical protein [Bacteroidales bacterium]
MNYKVFNNGNVFVVKFIAIPLAVGLAIHIALIILRKYAGLEALLLLSALIFTLSLIIFLLRKFYSCKISGAELRFWRYFGETSVKFDDIEKINTISREQNLMLIEFKFKNKTKIGRYAWTICYRKIKALNPDTKNDDEFDALRYLKDLIITKTPSSS